MVTKKKILMFPNKSTLGLINIKTTFHEIDVNTIQFATN